MSTNIDNIKIREPEKNSQLSEMPYFQAFFGIYFCTFDIKTTHSTCVEGVKKIPVRRGWTLAEI